MTVISLIQSNIIHRRSSAHKELTSQKDKARRFLAILLIFSLFLILFLYVLQVNNIAADGYKIRGLKERIEALENRNKILQVNISNLKSIGVLQSKTESFNMVKAQTIEYVTLPLPGVVVAK
jgi:cell division protein FtsB